MHGNALNQLCIAKLKRERSPKFQKDCLLIICNLYFAALFFILKEVAGQTRETVENLNF